MTDNSGGTYKMRMCIKTPVQEARLTISFETSNDASAKKIVDHLIDALKPSILTLGNLTCAPPRIVELVDEVDSVSGTIASGTGVVHGFVIQNAEGDCLTENLTWYEQSPSEAFVHPTDSISTIAHATLHWEIKPKLMTAATYSPETGTAIVGTPMPFRSAD